MANNKRVGFTINQLKEMCEQQIRKGNGDKHILISDDDEGNGYHELFFAFTEANKIETQYVNMPFGVDNKTFKEKYIVLG